MTGENTLKSKLMLENKTLWTVGLATAIRSLGYGATWPYLAIFFTVQLNVPIFVVGIIFTLFSAFSVLFSLLGGFMGDFIGRKATMLIGSITGFTLYLTIVFLYLYEFPVIVIIFTFLMTSFAGSLILPATSAIVADVTEEKRRIEAYGIYRILLNAGWAIGPVMGALIYDFGIGWIFLAVSFAHLIQFVTIIVYVKEPSRIAKFTDAKERLGIKFLATDRYLLLFGLCTFLISIVASQFSVTLPTYADLAIGIKTSDIGYIYAVNGIVVVLGQYPMIALMRKHSDVHTMMVGTALYSLGYFLVGFSTNLPFVLLDMVIITAGENLTSPGINTVVSKIAPPDRMGRYMGFISMVNAVGNALGPSIGTAFMALFNNEGFQVWLFVIVFGVVAIAILMRFDKMLRAKIKPNLLQLNDSRHQGIN